MKVKINFILLVIVILIILTGCASNGKTIIGTTKIPKENKIELDKIWEIQMDSQQSDYAIEGDKLYILTWNQSVYIVDINTGLIIKNFKLNIEETGAVEGRYSTGVAVNNGILAINYVNRIIVIDTNTEEIILKHQVVKGSAVAIDYHILMDKDLLIFSHLIAKKIYAINYRTGEVQWQYGGDIAEHGNFTLYKYKEKFLYSKSRELAYYEFDPQTGNILQKYQVESAGEIKNEKQSFFIPVFDNMEDHQFKTWLRNRSFNVFYLSDKGYIFTEYEQKFYFHGTDGKLAWDINFTKEIYVSEPYGRYAILYFSEKNKSKSMSILDLEAKEIVWIIDYDIASKPQFFVNENRLYLPGLDGSFKVFDLGKLEQ